MTNNHARLFYLGLMACVPATAQAQDTADLAKKLSNPVASLISAPFQFNWDREVGPMDDGRRFTLNVQPVIPVSLSRDWNLISRTILPLVSQNDVSPDAGSQFGLGDLLQSLFVSPKEPTAGGLIWGVGPVFLLPTATDDGLGGEKWGAGPTGVVLTEKGPWTIGLLTNHIWSFAGTSSRADISATFLQPFLAHTTRSAWTFTLQTESTYDWEAEQWNVPIAALVAKVTKIGGQLVQFQAGPRYYAAHMDAGPKGWGFRFNIVLLYPKGRP